jgi:hydrogenase maturation protein HypF
VLGLGYTLFGDEGSGFHASLATAIVAQTKALREEYGVTGVGLSGCVFQNRLLTELALSALSKLGIDVYLHEGIPSGDGGISFGQVIEAGSKMP